MSEEKKSNYTGKKPKESEVETSEETAPDEKQVKQITTGKPLKRGIGRRIVESFTGDDMQNVGSYIFFEVLIPAAKTMITDAITQGLERALWGDNRPRSSGSRGGYINYSKMSSGRSSTRHESEWKRTREEPRTMSARARANHDFSDVVLPTRSDAADVRDQMLELIDTYQACTVADLYAMVGITGDFQDNKWGWVKETLYGIDVRPARGGGYILNLPRPEELA